MYLHEVASDSYVLLQAKWAVGKARELIGRLDPTHVIVHRSDPTDFYYLYTKSEAIGRLVNHDPQTTLFDAFNLHEYTSTPTLDAQTALFDAFNLHEYTSTPTMDAVTIADDRVPDRVVVMDVGHVVGFLDATELAWTLAVPGPPRFGPNWPLRRIRLLRRRRDIRGDGLRGLESLGPVPRSLVTQFSDQVRLAETVSLLVSLSAEPAQGSALPVALPVGSTIDVVVVPKHGLVLEGKGEGALVVSDEQETLPLQFKLKATELGPAKLQVLAFHQGQPLGMIILAPTVVPADQSADEKRASRKQEMASIVPAHQPDLSLLILEHQSHGQPALTFRLTALDPGLGLHFKLFGPVLLRTEPLQYFQEFFKDIESFPVSSPWDKAKVELHLAAKGSMLFEKLLPTDLQVLLWQLRDRVKVVRVDSEEPWIPWELCKLQGREDGRVVEGPFLCEAFAVTRWLPGIGLKSTLALKNVALVLPHDSGLPMATSEGEYVLALANGGRRVERVPATFLELRAALASGKYDGWHFTGHGVFRALDPNRSAMLLENREELTPEDLSGVVANLGLARPLVFLNACQIGRSALSLTDIGGWAAQFLRTGAAAFIGAYWSVYDQAAHDFARAFYGHLLAGMPVGTAVREARTAIRPLGDPTWLAYTVFADPMATVNINT